MKQVFNLLDSVKQDDTRWQLVYEPRELSVFFRTYSDSTIRQICFNNLDFVCGLTPKVTKINANIFNGNRVRFEDYHESLNTELILFIFMQLMQLGEIEGLLENTIDGLSRYPESCHCRDTP